MALCDTRNDSFETTLKRLTNRFVNYLNNSAYDDTADFSFFGQMIKRFSKDSPVYLIAFDEGVTGTIQLSTITNDETEMNSWLKLVDETYSKRRDATFKYITGSDWLSGDGEKGYMIQVSFIANHKNEV